MLSIAAGIAAAVLAAQIAFTGTVDPLTTLAMLMVILGYVLTPDP